MKNMKNKLLFRFILFYFSYNFSVISFKFNIFNKIIRTPEYLNMIQQMTIEDDFFIKGNLTTVGVLTAFNGIKVNSGISRISGTINLNPYTNDITNVGNSSNGGNINISTSKNNNVSIQTKNIILKSDGINIPNNLSTLPLTIDSQGIIRTLYSTKKMKENIKNITFDYSDIDLLKVYSFNYTEDSGLPTGEEWGFLAEDFIGTKLESCIIKNPSGKIININEKKIIAFLAAIIKKLVKQTKELETKIDKFTKLEEKIEKFMLELNK